MRGAGGNEINSKKHQTKLLKMVWTYRKDGRKHTAVKDKQ